MNTKGTSVLQTNSPSVTWEGDSRLAESRTAPGRASSEEKQTVRFLVVEDNPKLAEMLQAGFQEHAYSVDTAATGHVGQELATSNAYDVILLDIMLPDMDGIELCRNMRRMGVSAPILMLTALSQTQDKIEGLNAGADDYLTKPFEFEELMARVRALMRRAQPGEGTTLRFEDMELDLLQRIVHRGEHPIQLTTKEFALLEFFMRNPNRVLTRTMLGERVWDMNFEEESNVIEVYVSRLRAKVDKGFDQPLIHTVIGSGYVLSKERPAG